MWLEHNWYVLFGDTLTGCTRDNHMVRSIAPHPGAAHDFFFISLAFRDSRVVIGSVFIGMFALIIPLTLFFRVQSHFRLTYIVHAFASLLLALGVCAPSYHHQHRSITHDIQLCGYVL